MEYLTKSFIAQSLRNFKSVEKQIIRYARMSAKERIAHVKKNMWDAFCTIEHPNGRGRIQCGTHGWNMFGELADRLIASNPKLTRRANRDKVRSEIANTYIRHALSEDWALDHAKVKELMVEISRNIEKTFQSTEHYLPCVFFMNGGPDEFNIGPVTFIRQSKFFRVRREQLRQSTLKNQEAHVEHVRKFIENGFPKERAATQKDSRELARSLLASAIKTYKSYPWIACVRIENCDLEISKELTGSIVETALHVTRVLLGASCTRQVRLAYSRGDAVRTAELWASEDGVIHPQIGFRSPGPVTPDNWFEGLTQDGGRMLQVFGSALNPLADPQENSDLHARFIDAINWFGDAATDPEPTSGVVKYTSAIERLIFSEHGRERRIPFAKRLYAILKAFGCDYKGDIYEDALNIYEIRSGLLHGGYSPRAADMWKRANLASDLSRLCILCMAYLYPMILQADGISGSCKLEERMKLIEDDGLDSLAAQAGWSKKSNTTNEPE